MYNQQRMGTGEDDGHNWDGRKRKRRHFVTNNVDIALSNFSRALQPTRIFLEEGQKVLKKLHKGLAARSSYQINRIYCAGSMGKDIAIMHPDIQIYAFVNQEEPQFKEILEDFGEVVQETFGISGSHGTLRRTNWSLSFTVPAFGAGGEANDGAGFRVELLPAANFVEGETIGDVFQIQATNVLQRVSRNPHKIRFYRSSLIESQAEFLRVNGDTEYLYDLIRLGKFWMKSMYLGYATHVENSNYLVELLCVASMTNQRSLYDSFMIFLSLMKGIEGLKLAFFKDGKKWSLYLDKEVQQVPAYIMEKFPGFDFTQRRHFVLEPFNYFNDMLENINATVLKKLVDFAKDTMDRFRLPKPVIQNDRPFLALSSIFRPMPTKLISADLHLSSSCLQYFCGGVTKSILNPTQTIRNNGLFKISRDKMKVQAWLDAHVQYILTTVRAAAFSDKRQDLGEIVDSVCKMISNDILGYPWKEWPRDSSKNHEDFDITFYIPAGDAGSVVVSLNCDRRGRIGGNCKQ